MYPKNCQKCHFYSFLRLFTAQNDSEWWPVALYLCMIVSLCLIIIVSPFFDQSGSFVSKKLSKMPFFRLFTAFYGTNWRYMMTGWPVFLNECVLVPDNHCLTISWPQRRFWTKKTFKNANFTAFYGILGHFKKILKQKNFHFGMKW